MLGIELNLDVRKYADPRLNAKQMEIIRLGLSKKLNVDKLLTIKPRVPPTGRIRVGQEFLDNSSAFLRELCGSNRATPNSVDYQHFVDSNKFDNMQLYQIKLGLDSKVDVKVYAKPIYTWKQMQYIRYGLEEGLNIEYYSVPNFSAYQMHLIYKGLLVGLDVENYAIFEYDWEHMSNIMNCNIVKLCTKYQLDSMQETELRMAIDSGHHISNFLDHGYTGEGMREIRLKLNKMRENNRL